MFADIQEQISQRVELGYNNHVVVAEITETENTFHSSGNFSFIPEKTLFEIGSITKLFTAHLILIFEKRGFFSLNDSVKKFLNPSIQVDPKICIYHLLTHTSGIEDPLNDGYYNQKTGNTVKAAEFSLNDLYAHIKNACKKSDYKPGDRIIYSNLGYALLGNLLEIVTGKTYDQLLLEEILIPLKMESTFVLVPSLFDSHLVKGTSFGRPVPYWDTFHLPAFGSLKSTAEDLSIYLRALFLNQSSPLDQKIIEKLLYPQTVLPSNQEINQSSIFTEEIIDGRVFGTYGLTIDKRFGGEIYVASGNTLGFSSFLGFDPLKKRGIIVLADSSAMGNLGHHFLHSDFPLQSLHRAKKLSEKELQSYVGSYRNDGIEVHIVAHEDYLELLSKNELPLILFPAGENIFFLKYLGGNDELFEFLEENGVKKIKISLDQEVLLELSSF